MKKTNRNFLLWSINLNGYEDIYIFGSVHFGSTKIFEHLPTVREYIDRVDCVMNEVDMNKLGTVSPDYYYDPSIPPLSQQISAIQYKRFSIVFKKISGLELDHFESIPPFFIYNLLLSFLAGQTGMPNIDSMLYDYAAKNGKYTCGLEDFDEHFACPGKIDNRIHLRNLKAAFRNISKVRKQHKKIEELYSNTQVERLHKKTSKGLGRYKKVLIYDRNIIMKNSILEQAKQQKVLAVMGLGHLLGQRGVLELMKENGARLEGIRTI